MSPKQNPTHSAFPGSVTAIIALGSNLGERESNIKQAIIQLDADPRIEVAAQSTLIETPRWQKCPSRIT